VLGVSETTKDFVFTDVKGNEMHFDSLLEKSHYTLIINVNFKKSKDSKKVRLFVEDSFAPQLENKSLGVYQLLDLSEYKNNNLVRSMVISALKRQNSDKPVLLDFKGDFEDEYNADKKKISCFLFDKHGNLKWAVYLDHKFDKECQDSLYRALKSTLNERVDNLFTIKDVENWQKLLKDLKGSMNKETKIPLTRLLQFADSTFIKTLTLWDGGEPSDTVKKTFIFSLNRLISEQSFFLKEYWPDSLLNEDVKMIINRKMEDLDMESVEKLNFHLINDILKPYKVKKGR